MSPLRANRAVEGSVARRLLFVLGGLFLLVVLAVVAVMVLVSPEDLKQKALARARAATGYTIEAGPAGLHVGFSGLSVRVADLFLAAPDSSQELRAASVDVRLRLLPLLSRRIEIHALTIHEPHYVRRAQENADPRARSPVFGFVAVEAWKIEDGTYLQESPRGALSLSDCDLEGGLRFDPRGGGEAHAHGTSGAGSWVSEGMRVELPPMALTLGARFNAALDTIRFPDVDLRAGEIPVALTGLVTLHDAGADWAFDGSAETAPWPALAAFLTAERRARIEAMQPEAQVKIPEIHWAGTTRRAGGRPIPGTLSGRMEIREFSADPPGPGPGITNGSANVVFTRERLELEGSGIVEDDPLDFRGTIDLPAQRIVSLEIDGTLDAPLVSGLFMPKGGALERGRFDLDVELSGDLPLSAQRPPEAHGTVRIQDLAGRARRVSFEGMSGTLVLAGDRGRLERVGGSVGKLALTDGTALLIPREGEILIEDARAGLAGGTLRGTFRFRPGTPGRVASYGGTFRLAEVPAGALLGMLVSPAAQQLVGGKLSSEITLQGTSVADSTVSPWASIVLDAALSLSEGTLREVPGLRELARSLDAPPGKDGWWPLRDLAGKLSLREGSVRLEELAFAIPGIDWTLSGGIGLNGQLDLAGKAVLDTSRVRLPEHVRLLARFVSDERGRIPVLFRVGGTFSQPEAILDWDGLAAIAAERARADGESRLQDEIEKAIQDPALRERLRKLLGGRREKP